LYFITRQPKYLRIHNEYTENSHLNIKASNKYSYRDPVPVKGYSENILGIKLADLGEMLHANFHLYSQLWNGGEGGKGLVQILPFS
jgi:hypothetical protein